MEADGPFFSHHILYFIIQCRIGAVIVGVCAGNVHIGISGIPVGVAVAVAGITQYPD